MIFQQYIFTGVMMAALVALLGGCAEAPKPDPYAKQYQCGDTLLPVRQEGSFDWLELMYDGEKQILPHVKSASGVRYDNGRYTFWLKGEEGVLLKRGQVVLQGCRLLPPAAATAPSSAE